MIADCRFEPAAIAASLGQKDIQLAVATAENLGLPPPLAAVLRDRFLILVAPERAARPVAREVTRSR
jgi:3-hydroxyisobutyrate dehydrogenase-like beta-hydroxyacid dehydrogenase